MLARGKKKASPSNGDILVVEKNGDQNIYPYPERIHGTGIGIFAYIGVVVDFYGIISR